MNDNKQNALATVLIRNDFYRDGYKRVILAILGLLVINLFLAIVLLWQWFNPPKPQYFAMTADGRMITIHPLSDPVFTNDHVLQWATDAARRAYSLDFLHWRQNLQDESKYFTPDGWKFFLAALKSSNNLNTIKQYNMVSTAEVTGSPTVVAHAIISGHYAWKIQMPLLVTYTNGNKTINQSVELTLLVIRMPVWQTPDRIAINNFIPNERGEANA